MNSPISSGTTSAGTSSDASVNLLAIPGAYTYKQLVVINEGSNGGFLSIDTGTTWMRLPASGSRTITGSSFSSAGATIQIRRTPGGGDLSGVYADAL